MFLMNNCSESSSAKKNQNIFVNQLEIKVFIEQVFFFSYATTKRVKKTDYT